MTPVEQFDDYLKSKGLRQTEPRRKIVEIFFSTDKHVSAQELFDMTREKHPEIGYATVSRTLKLLVDSGISWVVDFGDGCKRFDHIFGCKRHDHIICTSCDHCVEVIDNDLEKLKKTIAEEYGYMAKYTKLDIFGLCPNCRQKL